MTFADATLPVTTASFAAAGRYRLRFTADDSQYSAEKEVGISIFDPAERTLLKTVFGSFWSDHRFSTSMDLVTPDERDIAVTGSASSGLMVSHYWQPDADNPAYRFLEVRPAPGGLLAAELEYEVGRPPAGSPAVLPRLFLQDAEAIEGRVAIKEISFAGDGSVSSLWLTYEARFGDSLTDWKIGEIRIRASAAADVHQPLQVRAIGSATKVQQGEPLWLGQLILNDGLGASPITQSWSQVSGPGTATITEDGDSLTKALFSAPGIYILRVTVTQGTEVVTADLTIEQENRDTSINLKTLSDGSSPDRAYFYNLDSSAPISARGAAAKNEVEISCGGTSVRFTKYRGGQLWAGEQLVVAASGQNVGWITMSNVDEASNLQGVAGDLSIHQITWDASGALASFHATFLLTGWRFEGLPQAKVIRRIRGEVRWRATVPDPPANLAPEVSSGETLVGWAAPGKDALLELSADDDVLPPRQPLTYQWEMVNGPAPVTFQSPNRPRTQAHFSAPGSYRLRLVASDGELSGSNEMRVTVGSALMSGRYSGLITVEGVGAGLAKVTLNANGRFSGSLRIGGTNLPFSGTFQGSLWQKTWPLVGGGTLRLTINRSADGLSLVGKISDGETTFDFTITQTAHAMLVKDGLPTIPAGIHNFILGSSEMPGAPAGHGFGKITLSKTGTARIAGTLADGTAFSFSGDVQAGNTIALWVPLYSARGELAGPVNLGEEWFASGLIWLRPEHRGKRYPAGFGVPLYLAASPYQAPKRGNGVLTLDATPATGSLDLFAEADAAPRNYTFTLGATHRFALDPGDGPVLTVAPATGLFTGRFVDQAKRTRTIKGVMLQGIGIGGGYFLDETQSRAVQIESSLLQ